jgi:FMN hydrolase / 5-amino-6-(5-phospho-D-ribitylamino)uracil phosphatase
VKAVSFDFGQTLAELDYEFLQQRLAERGAGFDVVSGRAASTEAWQIYGSKKGDGHALAWRAMFEHILRGGGVPSAAVSELGAWLWAEQPRQNLWRRPIAGMIELVRELGANGVPVGIISNSEGHLAELVVELGWGADFEVVVDSGRVGIDKPDPGIFLHACAALRTPPSELVHVGDAWEADVKGALGAAASAIWFDARHRERELPARSYGAGSAAELREVLARLGLLS